MRLWTHGLMVLHAGFWSILTLDICFLYRKKILQNSSLKKITSYEFEKTNGELSITIPNNKDLDVFESH